MNKVGVDLIGDVSLLKESGRLNPLTKNWWGHGNLKGNSRNDSYYINLIDKEILELGGKAKAEFKFKFSDDERFAINVSVGEVIELNEGSRKIGEFIIQEIVNKELK